MADLPELPPKFQNAFEAAKATAELGYVNRAEDFPHHPQLAESGLQQLIRIQAVFFAYCDQARDACREGVWTATQVSTSVDAAWPIICDFYSLRERGASSDEAKSRFRLAIWKTVQDEHRWKRHLSEVAALAETATKAASTARAATGQPTEHPVAANRPSLDEIEKFADHAFSIAGERVATEHADKQRRALNKVARTRNQGGYLPALIKCAEERVREMIIARADAYVDAFTTFGVPSDARSEASLNIASRQIAGAAISGIRGQLDLLARRTRMPLNQPGGNINRKVEAARKSALQEGLLKLKLQRIKFNAPQPAVGASKLGDPDFWRRLRKEFDELATRQLSMLGQATHPTWLKAYCSFSKEFGEYGYCRIRGGLDGRLISDFEDAAIRGTYGLGCPPGVKPVEFWLYEVAQNLLNSPKPEIRQEFSPGDQNGGHIPGLLESSAGYCSRPCSNG